MKIQDPGSETIAAALQGQLAAIDRLLLAVQPGVFNLALRMLGRREDAADATQEILLKVITHLADFRGRAAFTTWVFQVARNHLLNALTRRKESPEVSLESLGQTLQQGLDWGEGRADSHPRSLTPEDKLQARQVALSCTQGMLMALDREQRLAYVLDVVFGLPSKQAADVMGLRPEAYRQRLSRARARLDGFTRGICGLAHPEAACRCEKQLPALAERARRTPDSPREVMAIHPAEKAQAQQHFDALVRMGDAAALFRAHPDYQTPESMLAAIRAVLRSEGYGTGLAPH